MVPRRAGVHLPPSLFLFAKGNVWVLCLFIVSTFVIINSQVAAGRKAPPYVVPLPPQIAYKCKTDDTMVAPTWYHCHRELQINAKTDAQWSPLRHTSIPRIACHGKSDDRYPYVCVTPRFYICILKNPIFLTFFTYFSTDFCDFDLYFACPHLTSARI